jgi:AraC family transcriptional regulator
MCTSRDSAAAAAGHAQMVPLVRTGGFAVMEFRCPGTPSVTEPERARYPEIVFPRTGSYLRSNAAGDVLLDRTMVAFFEAGDGYVIRHFRPAPDISTVIAIRDRDALHDALGLAVPHGRAFAVPALRPPPALRLLHRRLLARIRRGDSQIAVEETAAAIIAQALLLNIEAAPEGVRHRARRKKNFRSADAVLRFLAASFRERIGLDDVARVAGLSVFHLCREFRATMGQSIHRHLVQLRLDAAAAELLETRRSVTEIAHGLGFSSHGHLTALFTRTFGMPPSALRRASA